MTAAIKAAQEGKSVIVLEKGAVTGGNTSRSTGGMNAAKTVLQDSNEFGEDAGVEKTLKAAEAYPELLELAGTVQAEYDEYKAKWVGAPLSKEEIIKSTGINNVYYLDSFNNVLNNILVSGLTVGVSSEYDKEVNERDDLRLRWIKHLNYCSDYELNKYSDEYNLFCTVEEDGRYKVESKIIDYMIDHNKEVFNVY